MENDFSYPWPQSSGFVAVTYFSLNPAFLPTQLTLISFSGNIKPISNKS